jgi:hypothetical protein
MFNRWAEYEKILSDLKIHWNDAQNLTLPIASIYVADSLAIGTTEPA